MLLIENDPQKGLTYLLTVHNYIRQGVQFSRNGKMYTISLWENESGRRDDFKPSFLRLLEKYEPI